MWKGSRQTDKEGQATDGWIVGLMKERHPKKEKVRETEVRIMDLYLVSETEKEKMTEKNREKQPTKQREKYR